MFPGRFGVDKTAEILRMFRGFTIGVLVHMHSGLSVPRGLNEDLSRYEFV